MRHYTTISVSQIDEAVAAEALADRCCQPLSRANSLAETNIRALEKFADEHNNARGPSRLQELPSRFYLREKESRWTIRNVVSGC